MFRGQNEDTQTRELGWNKYITITEEIYKIQVFIQQLGMSFEIIGIYRTSHQLDEYGTRPF